jgi:hypothetical protein
MARTFWSVLALLTVTALCQGQSLKGAQELSLSAQFGQFSSKLEYRAHVGQYHESETYSDTYTFLTTTMRLGTFVTRGLEIAPELNWSAIENSDAAFSMAVNAEYNFTPSAPGAKLKTVPFVLAGYGIGNAVPWYFAYLVRSSEEFDVPVLNLGAGIKTFLSERAALRVEYRFQRFHYDSESGGETTKSTYQYHRFMFGFSLFFPHHARRSAENITDPAGCAGCGTEK